jgi:hypothetical protein
MNVSDLRDLRNLRNIEDVCDAYACGEGLVSLKDCVFLHYGTPELFQATFRAGFRAIIEKNILVDYCYQYLTGKRVKSVVAEEFCKEFSEKLG